MAGAIHGNIAARLLIKLGIYLEQNPLGELYVSNTTFRIGVQERMPDVSFVLAARFPAEGQPTGKWEMAPDLAIEVISPTDIWDKVNEKVHEYFAGGVQQVWLVSQPLREVTVLDSPKQIRVVTAEEDITSEKLLPGFKCRVADLFRD